MGNYLFVNCEGVRKQSGGLFLARHGESYAFASLRMRRIIQVTRENTTKQREGIHRVMDAIQITPAGVFDYLLEN